MPRTPEQNREYMREYRRVKRLKDFFGLDASDLAVVSNPFQVKIAELEEEVRHLKEELAKRPTSAGIAATAQPLIVDAQYGQRFNTRPFTPSPKPGKR